MPISKTTDLKELLSMLSRRVKFIVIAVLVCTLVGTISFAVAPRKYRSTTTILILPQRVPESYVRSTVSLRIEDRLASMRQQIMSRTRLLSLIDELKLFDKRADKRPDDELVEQVRKGIELQIRGHDSFVLSYTHEDRQMAMLTTSKLASYFIDENLRLREQQAVGTSDFLESQLQEMKAKLESQEGIVKQYRTKYMGQLPQQLEANIAALNRWQDQFRSVSDTLRSAEDRKLFYESQLNSLGAPQRPSPRSIVTTAATSAQESTDAPVVSTDDQNIIRDFRNKQARLAELSTKYTDDYPEVKNLRMELDRLEKGIAAAHAASDNGAQSRRPAGHTSAAVAEQRLDPAYGVELQRYQQEAQRYRQEEQRLSNGIKSTEIEIASLKKKLHEVEKNISDFQVKIDSAPKREQELYSINRDYENLKSSYNDLLRKKLDAQVSTNLEKQQKGAQFQIVDPPNLPETPVSPAKMVFLMLTLFSACVVGIGGAFLMEYLDKTLAEKESFVRYFNIPVLVSIPMLLDAKTIRRRWINNVVFVVASSTLSVMILAVLYYTHFSNT